MVHQKNFCWATVHRVFPGITFEEIQPHPLEAVAMKKTLPLLLVIAGGCCCGDLPKASTSTSTTTSSTTSQPAKQDDEPAIYMAKTNLVAAIDSKFLDSAPYLSPANFAEVEAGTLFGVTWIGGIFSGNSKQKMWYELTTSAGDKIYVYRPVFESQFLLLNGKDKPPAVEAAETSPEPPDEPPAVVEPSVEPETPKFEQRNWSDASGKFSVDATFVSLAGQTVTLRKSDGSTIKVPRDRLGDADQDYLNQLPR
jgi:hypothetical protein